MAVATWGDRKDLDTSRRKRKLVEEAFGWVKRVAGQWRARYVERWKIAQHFTIAAADVPSSIILVDAPGGKLEAAEISFDEALAIVTIDAARNLGIAERVGSIEVGKDADLALYDGDPFEYTTRCVGTIIDGTVVSRGESPR